MTAAISQIELLKQKLALIIRMRDLTASAEISGDRAEESYIALMSRREAILTRLKELDTKLRECPEEEGAVAIRGQISETADQIIEMDNGLALSVPELMKGIKNHLKQIKTGRSINRAYHNDVFGITGTYNLMK
ncbi:MAG: hypothetical protein LBS84_13090 [Clostridiales bacterium]|jgi:hypothetical protein|nr:hypothetical protein [Clostridiales bacterium]